MKKSRFLIVATALILAVLMIASICIFASSESTANLTVDAGGGKVKVFVNDELKSHGTSAVSLKVPVGASVKLVVEENLKNFLFWTNSAFNTCAGEETGTYEFTMRNNGSFKAWFKPTEGSLVVYRNNNTSAQVLASASYTIEDTFTEHLVKSAAKDSHTFEGWELTTEEIQTKIKAGVRYIEVTPKYTSVSSTYTINVEGGTIGDTEATSGSYAHGTQITLVAADTQEGKEFSAWKNSKGIVVSTEKYLTISVSGDETFTAVFSEDTVDYKPEANLVIVTDKTLGVLKSTSYFFVPQGNIIEYGVIYSKNVKCAEHDLIIENIDGQTVKSGSFKGSTGILVNRFVDVESVSARAYFIYTKAGTEYTVYSDVVFAEYDDTILKLDISEDGIVSNASANGVELVSHDYINGGAKRVVADKVLDRKVVSFEGSINNPSVYNFPASSFNEDFADGFTVELLFNLKGMDFKYEKGYVGIFDYEEAGGFGINAYDDAGVEGKVNLKAEFAKYNEAAEKDYEWITLTYTINKDQWYHCVFVFDGSKISLYIDGELKDSEDIDTRFFPPEFEKRAGEEYICIGACMQGWVNDVRSTGDFGFTGSIATANVYYTPILDTNKIAKMHAKAMVKEETTIEEQEIIDELLNTKIELRVHEDGSFKVVTFSDVQCSTDNAENENLKKTINNIETIVERERPDLVLFLGDNSYGMNTAGKLKNYLTLITEPIESRQIPWAHIFGNHDDETAYNNDGSIYYSAIPKAEQQEIYESFEYCISRDVKYGYDGEELFGVGNHVIPVLSNDGTKVAFNIFGLDSGSYSGNRSLNGIKASHEVRNDPKWANADPEGNYFGGHYEYIQQNQVEWYVETAELLQKYNGDSKPIPAMIYFHIPLQETYFAWNLKDSLNLEYDGHQLNYNDKYPENISAPAINGGLFEAAFTRGDVKLMAYGHDHLNDFMVKYNGIKLCYNGAVGTEVYHDDSIVGGRVINFNTYRPDDIETHMSYVNAKTENAILDLSIAGDAVSNIALNGNALVHYDGTNANSVTSIVTHEALNNRKAINFKGAVDKNASSMYYMNMNDTLSSFLSDGDGFAVESIFKVTATPSSNYVGIIDYAEGGGFALNYYSNKNLTFDMGHSTEGYVTLATPIKENVWYHVLVNYDPTTLKLSMYLNGALVDQDTVVKGYRAPTNFSDNYLCVGACAGNGYKGTLGMTGDIATARIWKDSMTTDEIVKRYNSEAAYYFPSDGTILKMTIGNDNSVTNTSASGPAIIPYINSNEAYTSSIKTDETLNNRKVINFKGGEHAPSTYRIYPETIEADLASGFAYEVLFKPTDSSTYLENNTAYAGVLEYDEGYGGFGLRYVTVDEDSIKLQFTFNTDKTDPNATNTITFDAATVDVGNWYHVIFSYDGANIKIWINGVNVYNEYYVGNYKTAHFGSEQPFVCIGAAAWGNNTNDISDTGIYGLKGNLAIANIYSNPVDSARAAELYTAIGLSQ